MAWPQNQDQIADWILQTDAEAGFEITPEFERFNQMDDMFTRAFWDPDVKSDKTQAFFDSHRAESAPRRGPGFSQKDFALRNAAWALSNIISSRSNAQGIREGFQAPIANDTPIAPAQAMLGTPEAEAVEIKKVARLFGADLVGITGVDPRWHYSHRPDVRDMTPVENTLPDGINNVIVMGHSMDFDLVETYPSALGSTASGREYSHEAAICIQLATYIRNLGYQAVASMNDTALVIPYAIKAGLGEYGRNQMVLTPQFGPRVRFSKIFTDMPLAMDRPQKLGLSDYCHDCTICADSCPPKALPKGEPDEGQGSRSTIKGVRKWSANCEACFGYWAKLQTDCAICMRVCPFNRRGSWADRAWVRLARGRGASIARWIETKRGKRQRMKPADWWAAQNPD